MGDMGSDIPSNDTKVEEKKFKKKRKSSYEAPKSCELMENISATNKKIKLFQQYDKYFDAKPADGNKGFMISQLTKNEFGQSLGDLGIDAGWKVTECADKKLKNTMFAMLKNQISAVSNKNDAKIDGYCLVFENASSATKSSKFPP